MSEEEKTFDWFNRDQDEEIVWSGKPRVKSIIPAVIFGIPLIAAGGIGLLVIIGAYLSVKHTDFVVTSDSLYRKKGVLSRSVKKIDFDKVQNISFSQGIFGKKFDYGTIEISTAGGSGVEMRFRSIRNPREVQNKINDLIKDEQSSEKSEEGRTEKEILEKILSEVQEINEKL